MSKDYECILSILDDESTKYQDSLNRECEGKIKRDSLAKMTVERFNHWVANYEEYCDRKDLSILGWHLYNMLFDSEGIDQKESIREAFEKTFDVFQRDWESDHSKRLKLILKFHKEAKELVMYPWEFIFMERKPRGFFLAGEKTELILTRFVPESPQPGEWDPKDKTLRILVVFSHPREEDIIDADHVITDIKNMQDENNNIKVESVENVTFKDLETKMKTYKPHIFHFIGHGEPGKIALIRDKKDIEEDRTLTGKIVEAQWIDNDTIKELFSEHKPRLVFLHACNGAKAGSLDSFNSTARELVYERIPAVVAMQYEVENEDAAMFAKTFYEQISIGKDIDEAVQIGRHVLGRFHPRRGSWGDRRFGTPVVYLQSQKAIIIPSEQAPIISSKVNCPYSQCTKIVDPGRRFCACDERKRIGPCPNCGLVYAKEEGFCTGCGYQDDSIQVNQSPETAESIVGQQRKEIGRGRK